MTTRSARKNGAFPAAGLSLSLLLSQAAIPESRAADQAPASSGRAAGFSAGPAVAPPAAAPQGLPAVIPASLGVGGAEGAPNVENPPTAVRESASFASTPAARA